MAEINFNGKLIHYEILDTLEFTSDRKRMSVVVKDSADGKILLLSKGADEAILPIAYAGNLLLLSWFAYSTSRFVAGCVSFILSFLYHYYMYLDS